MYSLKMKKNNVIKIVSIQEKRLKKIEILKKE